MKIEPTYLTFEQCKMLKEKGLNAICQRYWVRWSSTDYKEMSNIELVTLDYEIGIGNNLITPKYEQWQVVEWLRLEHNIFVSILHKDVRNQPTENNTYIDFKGFTFYVVSTLEYKHLMSEEIDTMLNGGIGKGWGIVYNSPQEAYSSAFDFILKELI
jgi:hypothetical protein